MNICQKSAVNVISTFLKSSVEFNNKKPPWLSALPRNIRECFSFICVLYWSCKMQFTCEWITSLSLPGQVYARPYNGFCCNSVYSYLSFKWLLIPCYKWSIHNKLNYQTHVVFIFIWLLRQRLLQPAAYSVCSIDFWQQLKVSLGDNITENCWIQRLLVSLISDGGTSCIFKFVFFISLILLYIGLTFKLS